MDDQAIGRMARARAARAAAAAVLLVAALFCPAARFCAGRAWAQAQNGVVKIDGTTAEWRAYELVAGEVRGSMISECDSSHMNRAFWDAAGIEGTDQDAAEALHGIADGDSQLVQTARLGRAAEKSGSPHVAISALEAAQGKTLDSGYWLFVSDSAAPMLLLVGPAGANATVKSTVPSVSKQVMRSDGSWDEEAVASSEDQVAFRLVAKAPSDAGAYDKMPFVVVDRLPKGLACDSGDVTVQLETGAVVSTAGDGSAVTADPVDITSSCDIDVSGREVRVDVGKGDALPVLGDSPGTATVTVYLMCYLQPNAKSGLKNGNVNDAWVEWPGSPTADGEEMARTGALARTERDDATVYTWKVVLVKTGSGEPLPGATFELKSDEGVSYDDVQTTGKRGRATFALVGDGVYTLAETGVPSGWEPAGQTKLTIEYRDTGVRGTGKLAASAEGAGRVVSASARTGVVKVAVDDEPSVPSGGAGGPAGGAELGSYARTGATVAGLVAAALAALALGGRLLRRGRQRSRARERTCDSSVGNTKKG